MHLCEYNPIGNNSVRLLLRSPAAERKKAQRRGARTEHYRRKLCKRSAENMHLFNCTIFLFLTFITIQQTYSTSEPNLITYIFPVKYMKMNLKKYTLIAERYYEIYDETVGLLVKFSNITKNNTDKELLNTYKQFNEALDEMDKRGSFPISSLDEVPGKIRENLLSQLDTFKATLSEMRKKAEFLLLQNGITPKTAAEEIEKNTVKPPDADNTEDVANPNEELFQNIKNLKRSLKMNRLLAERYYEIFKEKVTDMTNNMQTTDRDTIDNLAVLYVEYKEELDEVRKSGSVSSYRLYDLPEKMKASVLERHKIFTEAMDELERRGLDEIRKHLPPPEIEEDSENSASGRAITGTEEKKELKKKEPHSPTFDEYFDLIIGFVLIGVILMIYAISQICIRIKNRDKNTDQDLI
ncbi:hypothetical protein XELAEV_18021986mg [Xenopus laevis]|uniref:Uncharacterized protein n=2 Tax=Xenopus laevis TaxID=8355 RepID=A0A974D3V8_XENLA|nr:hypothetical protein XELAEV_18021986mg [Xenopus laevis]